MSFPHQQNLSSRLGSRSGFTLVELLVVIGIIAILAGVALGPITGGIKTAQHNAGVQLSRQLAILEFQYSVDNNGQYPFGATAEKVATLLLAGKYTSDPNAFFNGGPGKTKYVGNGNAGAFDDVAAANVSWDFTCSSATAGITSSVQDQCPLLWSSGNQPLVFGAGPKNLTINTATNVYGADGIAATYKNNSAQFLKATAGAAPVVSKFLPDSYSDTTVYVDIAP